MLTPIIVFAVASLMIVGVAIWGLRAYRAAGGANARASLAMVAAVAIAGVGAYLAVGRPDLADAPFEARLAALKQRDPTTFNAEEALAVLAEAAREDPTDPLPHFFSGEIYLGQGQAREAARAYDAALRRDPANAETLLGLGRALVALDEGRVSPEALAAFQQAATLTNDPAPWIYQAMAAMEANDAPEARRLWGQAYQRMSQDDPRRAMAQRMSTLTEQ